MIFGALGLGSYLTTNQAPFFLNLFVNLTCSTGQSKNFRPCFSQPLIIHLPLLRLLLFRGRPGAAVLLPRGMAVGWSPFANERSQMFFSMKNFQNGQDFSQRMNLLLDNELTPEKEREMLQEIKTNPSYHKLLSQEKSFREFIKSRIHRKSVSPSLVRSIKEKIRSSRPG